MKKTSETNTAGVSWSGGKDSCLAMYRAMKQGYTIKGLLNMMLGKSGECGFHGVSSKLLLLQGAKMGIPVITHAVDADMKNYEEEFIKAVKALDVETMIYGDIYLEAHLDWVKNVSKKAGVIPLEPLWGGNTHSLVTEFVKAGFKTVIVSARAELFDKEIAGRVIDEDLIEYFMKKEIDPCGENGEFHTLVIDGPLFKSPVNIKKTETILKKGFWDHWFLDIKDFE